MTAPSSTVSATSRDGTTSTSDQNTSVSTNPSTTSSPESDPTADFVGDVAVNDHKPTTAELAKVEDTLVLAADGSSRPFKSLYSGEGVAKRVMVIFVRHFLCGNCQEYLRTLTRAVTPDSLLSLPVPTFITIIGCGRPELIPMYIEATGCPFPIYADPSRKLYDSLGMTRTLTLGPKPEYMRISLLTAMVTSVVQGLRQGTGATKAGDVKQVGGEFLFEDGVVTWCHRMRNTRDHAEVPKLRLVMGLDGAEKEEEKEKETSTEERTPARLRKRDSSAGAGVAASRKRWSTSLSRALSTRRSASPRGLETNRGGEQGGQSVAVA
ncbi:MAG: hypothetical protein M4579_005356 [Chaenotheca gracillima]|nr:MAG: hypothetical protein M4579_005356 [Chaenotheca gracillima]